MGKGLLPQNLPGVTQFLSGRAASRKVPLELVVVKCIVLKCISCGTPGVGKQALAPTLGSSPGGELPLLSPPPCVPDSLKFHQGDWCLPGSTSMLSRADVSAGSSRSASPKLSECGWKCLCVCAHIGSVHLTPVPFCVPSPRARVACAGCDSCGALASVCQHGALQI